MWIEVFRYFVFPAMGVVAIVCIGLLMQDIIEFIKNDSRKG